MSCWLHPSSYKYLPSSLLLISHSVPSLTQTRSFPPLFSNPAKKQSQPESTTNSMGDISVAPLHHHRSVCRRPLSEMQKPSGELNTETLHFWSSIQNDHKSSTADARPPPYVHPSLRRSSSLMTQNSLEICTESLGSETGSDGFSSGDEMDRYFSSSSSIVETEDREEETEEEAEDEIVEKKQLSSVNYHCSTGRRPLLRSFPPPLSSISRRDGPCIMMKPHRRDGRLVVQAVPVPSHNYLHAERNGGRLLLSLIGSASSSNPPIPPSIDCHQEEEETELQEEEEEQVVEEVEVVDRGSIVEVKVSTQPQVSGMAMVKLRRSSLVINKFVVGSPLAAGEAPPPETPKYSSSPPSLQNPTSKTPPFPPPPPAAATAAKRVSQATTTAAAAAVAASSISTSASTTDGFHYNYLNRQQNSRWGTQSPAADAKLLFTSTRLSREELLHDMRRCSELRRPLFIFEQPYCIATSS